MLKRTLAVLLITVMTFVLGVSVNAASTIAIKIDNKIVASDVAPIISNGRTLAPVRVIAESLGAVVAWDGAKRKATVISAEKTIEFTIGSKTAVVNGVSKTMDTSAVIVNNRTLIPLRFVSESMGADVDYDATTKTAIVNYFSKVFAKGGSIKIGGSTTVQPIAQATADLLMKNYSNLSISVAGGGSGAGVKGAADGTFNIGCTSREVTETEMTTYPTLKVYTIARDGIAIVVHKNNPVKNLTKEQIEKIFLGEIVNWKDVGGNNAPILVQTRETGSGTLDALKELVLAKKEVVSTATPYASTGLLKEAVAGNVNAIGFISAGYIDSTIKAVSVGSILPTEETIKNGSYPISRSLFVLTKGLPTGPSAAFIDYMRTAEGQKLIVNEGYVSIR